jgi:hypothetical protein
VCDPVAVDTSNSARPHGTCGDPVAFKLDVTLLLVSVNVFVQRVTVGATARH